MLSRIYIQSDQTCPVISSQGARVGRVDTDRRHSASKGELWTQRDARYFAWAAALSRGSLQTEFTEYTT